MTWKGLDTGEAFSPQTREQETQGGMFQDLRGENGIMGWMARCTCDYMCSGLALCEEFKGVEKFLNKHFTLHGCLGLEPVYEQRTDTSTLST